MSKEFQKFDTKKNRLELIEPEFIEGIGAILTYGAKKYQAWNWRKVNSQEDLDRIKGATMRHMMAYMKGEKNDPETGLSHLYHMGCNLMFLDYFDRNGLQAEPNVVENIKVQGFDFDLDKPVITDEKFEADVNKLIEREEHVIHALRGTDYILLHYHANGTIQVATRDLRRMMPFRTYEGFLEWVDNGFPHITIGEDND